MDKVLTGAVIVLLAALAPFLGFDVLPAEQVELGTAAAGIAAGVAGIVAVARAMALRKQARDEADAARELPPGDSSN